MWENNEKSSETCCSGLHQVLVKFADLRNGRTDLVKLRWRII